MIIFKKVRWKNFLSTGNVFTEISLNENKTTLFTGEVGAGKTSFLDAIAFSLFNKPFRLINKNNLVNSINQKNCLTEIEFSIGTNEYLVRRGIKPNIFEIHCNGELINQDSDARDYQEYLEKFILKLNYRSFIQVIMLGASNFTPFMLLKAADRREIIEELLDIKIFSVMSVLLKQKISLNKNSLQELEYKEKILNEKIELHKKYILDLKEDNSNKILEHENTIQENETFLLKNNQEITQLKESISLLQEKIIDIKTIAKQLTDIISLESKLENKENKLQKIISFYEENNNCPTCKQGILEDFKNQEISKTKEKSLETKEGLEQLRKEKQNVLEKNSIFEDIKKKISSLESDVIQKNSFNVGIQTYVSKLKKEIEGFKKPQDKMNKETLLLEDFVKEQDSIQIDKKLLLEEKRVQEHVLSLLKDTGIKSSIIKQYLPVLCYFTNKYLNDMSFFITFDMNENFEETIKSRGRDSFVYSNLSNGEQQMFNLALLFTWREIARLKNSVNCNLLILDEICDSYLDPETTDNILSLLTSKLFDSLNIFIISHKNTISDKFDKNIKFTKVGNFSRIES